MNIINNGNSFLLLKYRLTFAAGIKNKIDVMNAIIGKKKLTVSNKNLSDALFILWAGGAALLSYSLVYALRKPFTAATFDGLDFFGMDYKTATSIVQISGYFISKLIGIKVISELKKENRLKFIILSVAVAELSLVLFGALPQPFNVFALFFNGLSLGCMWGVIFSFLEGRRVTDLLASLMGLSIAISSGTAKSIGLFVMDNLHISEFWMPAFIGAFAFPLLSFLGWLMTRMPQPTQEDKELRTERVALDSKARLSLFKNFMPVLVMLFFANLFVTVLQEYQGRFSGEDTRCRCGGALVMGVCQGGCNGYIDNSVYVRADVRSTEQHKGVVYAVGAGHLRYGYVEFSGFQLFCFAIAAHDMAVPSKLVALHGLP